MSRTPKKPALPGKVHYQEVDTVAVQAILRKDEFRELAIWQATLGIRNRREAIR